MEMLGCTPSLAGPLPPGPIPGIEEVGATLQPARAGNHRVCRMRPELPAAAEQPRKLGSQMFPPLHICPTLLQTQVSFIIAVPLGRTHQQQEEGAGSRGLPVSFL